MPVVQILLNVVVSVALSPEANCDPSSTSMTNYNTSIVKYQHINPVESLGLRHLLRPGGCSLHLRTSRAPTARLCFHLHLLALAPPTQWGDQQMTLYLSAGDKKWNRFSEHLTPQIPARRHHDQEQMLAPPLDLTAIVQMPDTRTTSSESLHLCIGEGDRHHIVTNAMSSTATQLVIFSVLAQAKAWAKAQAQA